MRIAATLPKEGSRTRPSRVAPSSSRVAIAGQMGAATADGFVLEQPSIQVFERKARNDGELPKQKEAEAALASSSQQPSARSEVGAEAEAKTSQLEAQLPEKPAPLAKLPAPLAKPKLKKMGKFNVEVR